MRPLSLPALVLLATAGFASAQNFRFVEGDGYRDLLHGDRPLLRHMNAFDPARRAETYKPFIHVFGKDGKSFITKGPGGAFTHHRGLFIGWNKTQLGSESYDFWHCNKVERRHAKYLADQEVADAQRVRMVSVTNWPAPNGKPVIVETQTVEATLPRAGVLQLDFSFRLEAPSGPVKLNGDAQHAGFQFRAADEVEKRKDAKYERPAGAVGEKNDVWKECPWAVCKFKVKDVEYAVMHMNGPTNPQPTVYSTRDYGRFGAFSTPEVSPDKPLDLRFRVLVCDGDAAAGEKWAERYEEFARAAK